jgi:glutathione synthase/RimK-type ligase-like ATP-grasp enzyme
VSKQIAFVTSSNKPTLAEDDLHVLPFLEKKNILVQAKAWDDPTVNWQQFDALILRSCWNYHYHPKEFFDWTCELENNGVKIFNEPSIVKWNMHKSYLKDLVANGITMANTQWIDKGSSVDLQKVVRQIGSSKIIIKPCIAATAYQTFLVNSTNFEEEKIQNLLQEHDLIIQEFIPEVQTDGEWSLLFFNKEFSHSVIKKPKANDFRVQNDFGGSYSTAQPSEMILRQAKKIIQSINSPLLYARVDGVVSKGKFLLMELELIEPTLFLSSSQESHARFAKTISEII